MGTHVSIKNGLIGAFIGRKSYLGPTNLWFGLSLNTIASDGSGIVEPNVSTGYIRIPMTNSDVTFNDPINGMVTNKITFKFEELTEYAGIASDWFFTDTANGNTAVIWGKFASGEEKILQKDLTININVGSLKFNIFDV